MYPMYPFPQDKDSQPKNKYANFIDILLDAKVLFCYEYVLG